MQHGYVINIKEYNFSKKKQNWENCIDSLVLKGDNCVMSFKIWLAMSSFNRLRIYNMLHDKSRHSL